MPICPFKYSLVLSLFFPALVSASITVYYAQGHKHLDGTATVTAGVAGPSVYRQLLNPPPPPVSLNTQFDIQLQHDTPGLSIPQSGAFVGFSIEMSVANQICKYHQTIGSKLPMLTFTRISLLI
jgi:hypothetical protein